MMDISLLLRKFRRNLQDYGWSVTLTKTLSYFFQLAYVHHVYRIYRIGLTDSCIVNDFEERGLTFKFLGPEDHPAIVQIEDAHEWLRGSLKERITAGALCLTAFQGDKVAGFNLVGFGRVFMPLVHKQRTFRHGDAWSEQIAVQTEFRQMGLATQLRYRIFAELRTRGLKRLYGGALTSNIGSLKLARKVGFREIVDIHYRRILGNDSWRYKKVKS